MLRRTITRVIIKIQYTPNLGTVNLEYPLLVKGVQVIIQTNSVDLTLGITLKIKLQNGIRSNNIGIGYLLPTIPHQVKRYCHHPPP